MNLTQLVAGRELDALVAEKVMGLRVEFIRGESCGWQGDSPVLFTPNDYCVLRDDGEPDTCIYYPGGIGPLRVSRYSTDIAAAWQVVERMHNNGMWLSLKSPFSIDNPYRAGFTPHETTGFNGRPDFEGAADSAPLSICLAALKAVEAKEAE